ncbi:hypothetical protein [Lacticaseibacillus rhamnosus]|uniref:hypothetical protein n=1 Tax=Lacticaseibacillus rhamnosus TaxID=47715 RepID=UPI00298C76C1|nr:hypothetical protein [Lacticaseibacillus rhamnosus]
MKNGHYRFMSWLGFILCIVVSFMPEKYLAYGYYKHMFSDIVSNLVCALGHCGFNQGEAEMKQMIAVMLLISGAAMRAWVNWERR